MIKIEFSGTDAAGKSVALAYFAEQARNKGLTVVETREVGNPHIPSCVKLREFVLDPNSNLRGETMELIFAAMRFENDLWLQKLVDSQNPPDLVVSDRGLFDHLAYTDHNVDVAFTSNFYEDFVVQETSLPHVVVYFNVDTKVALERRVKRNAGTDVIEMKGVEYQEKVRDSFEVWMDEYSNFYPNMEFFEVDANQNLENVRKQLDEILDEIVAEIL